MPAGPEAGTISINTAATSLTTAWALVAAYVVGSTGAGEPVFVDVSIADGTDAAAASGTGVALVGAADEVGVDVVELSPPLPHDASNNAKINGRAIRENLICLSRWRQSFTQRLHKTNRGTHRPGFQNSSVVNRTTERLA